MTTVLSYGGGRQTIAMVVLMARKVIPIPDLIVMADTGRQRSETWRYLESHLKPFMKSNGIPDVEIASHSLATVDLYGHQGDLLIPAFTSEGKLPTFCSNEWKKRVVYRYIREQGVEKCEMWMGFSWDERRRASESGVQWVTNRFPLIDLRLDVHDCEKIVQDAGLPKPPRSSCWMCPHHDWNEWKAMKENDPEDFTKAAEIEREIHADDERGGVWLTGEGKFLDEIDFTGEKPPKPKDPNLFRGCVSGFCWT